MVRNIMIRNIVMAGLAAAALGFAVDGAQAQSTVKIGTLLPMTGPQQSTGVQITAAMRLYQALHGDTVAGKKVEIVLRDDGAISDNSKRLAQELIVNQKVNFVVGFGLTPNAFAVAPLATESKTPMVVMAAGTSSITERSPYIVRTSFTLPQSSAIMAQWALKNGLKKVVSMVSDFAPGIDSETSFKEAFLKGGGTIPEFIRVPLANPDFAPFLQRARDAKPDAVFIFVPAGQGATFVKQFIERGLDKAGIKIIGPGDVTDDDVLNGMGDQVIGTVTAHTYSAAHPSQMNKDYVAAIRKANNGLRPNFMSVGGYDGMHLIYEALKKTGGNTDGDALVAAMKGMAWESPRGPISIDPETRDIIQNVYMRRVEKVDGELYNVEFETFPNVKDPGKLKK
jgi:branched-chain amino acid transport system substrate-binding protein